MRPVDADALYQTEKLLDSNIVRQDKVASELLEQVLYDIQHFPTLTPPNEPLTCEGCAEIGKWENEYEYGYPSPCTRCKRRTCDNYRRPPERQEDNQ